MSRKNEWDTSEKLKDLCELIGYRITFCDLDKNIQFKIRELSDVYLENNIVHIVSAAGKKYSVGEGIYILDAALYPRVTLPIDLDDTEEPYISGGHCTVPYTEEELAQHEKWEKDLEKFRRNPSKDITPIKD